MSNDPWGMGRRTIDAHQCYDEAALAEALVAESDVHPEDEVPLWDLLSERHREQYRKRAVAIIARLR